MNELLRWLASWRDLQVEPSSELHVELAAFPSGGMGLLVILGIVGALGIVWFAYVRDARRLTRARRIVLMSLRTLAVLIATLLLLDPQIVAVRRDIQPGQTLVLVDTSQSMAQIDSFREPEVRALADGWRENGVADPAAASRIQLLRALLGRDDQRVIGKLRERNRVLVYSFSAGLEPLATLDLRSPGTNETSATDEPETAPPQRLDLEAIEAQGSYTNIGGAVRAALSQSAAASVAGVVVFSDGRRNLGAQGPEVARLLRNRGIPHVVVVPIGDPSPTRTLRIERVDAPEKVFQEDPFTIRGVLESRGYEESEFTVRLLREREGSDPEIVASQTARTRPDDAKIDVAFEGLKATEAGAFTYVVEIDPPDLESRVPERHVRRTRVEALGERTRVLMIAGGPSHEYRILRNLLTRDDTIELACWLSSADPGFPQDGNVSLEQLPTTREELETWDVYVLVDPDADRLDLEFCDRLAEQVTQNGAGLWWVCGEKFTRSALRDEAPTRALAELLPVVPDIQAANESIGLGTGMRQPWRYEITAQGKAHPAMRIDEDRAISEALWPRLPGFHFAFPVERTRPGAQVLVAHHKPARSGGATEEPQPLIATQFAGAGRVLFTATDDLFRWRSVKESAYDRLWIRGIRYLFEGRLNAGNSRLRVFAEEERIELGQAIKIVAEVKSETFEPWIADVYELDMRGSDGAAQRVALERVETAPGRYEAWVRPTSTGWFRVEAIDAPEGRPVAATFEVIPAALEKEGPVDLAELGAIASAPGGVLLGSPSGLLDALDAIASQTRIETFTSARTLWDSWATVALLLTVLAIEWWLRKRSNLL